MWRFPSWLENAMISSLKTGRLHGGTSPWLEILPSKWFQNYDSGASHCYPPQLEFWWTELLAKKVPRHHEPGCHADAFDDICSIQWCSMWLSRSCISGLRCLVSCACLSCEVEILSPELILLHGPVQPRLQWCQASLTEHVCLRIIKGLSRVSDWVRKQVI